MAELGQVRNEHITLHRVQSVTQGDVRRTAYPDGTAACSVPQCNNVINALRDFGTVLAVTL